MRETRDEPGCVRKDTTPRRRPPIAEVVRGGVRTVESSHTRPGRQPGMSGKIVTCNDGTCPGPPRSGHDSWPREGLRSVGSDLRRHFGPCPRPHSRAIAPPPGRGRPGRLGCGRANGYGERSWMYLAGCVRRSAGGLPGHPRPPAGGSRTSEGHRRVRASGAMASAPYGARDPIGPSGPRGGRKMERETGFEPATLGLEGRCSSR